MASRRTPTATAHEDPLPRLIARLEAGGFDPRPTGPDSYESRCPAHGGSRHNLTIARGDTGAVLVHCHHAPPCTTEDVVAALGLTVRDLFHGDAGEPHVNGKAAPKPPKKAKKVHPSRERACDAVLWKLHQQDAAWAFVRDWEYHNADGSIAAVVCRFERPDGQGGREKSYAPIHPEPGGWVTGAPVKPWPLYGLVSIRTYPAATVYFVEGEKCADAVRELGEIATTTMHGAKSPQHTDLSPLAGRDVVTMPDNDPEGESYALKVASMLEALNPPARVKIVRLPLEQEGDDAADWIEAGGTRDELLRLAAAAPEWSPPAKPKPAANGHINGHVRVNRISGIDGPEDLDARLAKLPRTDLGNAERLVERHGADLRYSHPWKSWVIYDGTRWREDDTAEIYRRAKDTTRRILSEASTLHDDERVKAHVGHAFASEKRARLEAMISLAASEPGVPILPDQLDRDPWLFNCPNGTIDLRTGELRKHRRSDLISRCSPTVYDPNAECPLWESVLRLIFEANERLIAYLQRFCGYALTGLVRDHCFPICHGNGANGKSTFLNALLDTWGSEYAMKASADLLMLKRSDGHPTGTADLFGRRLVVCIETSEGRRINETFIKEACGGDRIRARRLYQDSFEFLPSHKLVLATNHAPHVVGTDLGYWRRVNLVPFNVTLGPGQADTTVPERLRSEASGILAWAVRGCLAWQETGLRPPDEVEAATQQYRESEDVLAAFLTECCHTGSGDFRVKATPLYLRFRAWAEASGETTWSQRKFGRALRERGFESYPNNGIWYRGIGLREVDSGESFR